MSDFVKMLLKIRSGFYKQMRLLFILDFIAIFCIFYSTFIILNVDFFLGKSLNSQIPVNIFSPVCAFIIALIGAFLLHRKDENINVNVLIENRFPELNERLRTAYDNRNESNDIIESLKRYVYDKLVNVSSSHLLNKSSIHAKIIVSIILIFAMIILIFTPNMRLAPDDVAKFAGTINEAMGNLGNETYKVITRNDVDINKAENSGSGNISGEPTIARVEGKPFDLLNAGVGEGNIPKDYTPFQNQFIRSGAFPVDIHGSNVSDRGYGILIKRSETEKELINRFAVERSKI